MSLMRVTLAVLVSLLLGMSQTANAQVADAVREVASIEPVGVLDDAVAGYAQALDTEDRDLRLEGFRRVERLFASVVDAGYQNADLYANLGNAALQAEHLGNPSARGPKPPPLGNPLRAGELGLRTEG